MATDTVEITQEEYAKLREIKDELHSLKAYTAPLCTHVCEHGHKAINEDAAAKAELVKLNAKLDREDKEKRLGAEAVRLDGLVRAGRIDRQQKEKIIAQERERMGL